MAKSAIELINDIKSELKRVGYKQVSKQQVVKAKEALKSEFQNDTRNPEYVRLRREINNISILVASAPDFNDIKNDLDISVVEAQVFTIRSKCPSCEHVEEHHSKEWPYNHFKMFVPGITYQTECIKCKTEYGLILPTNKILE